MTQVPTSRSASPPPSTSRKSSSTLATPAPRLFHYALINTAPISAERREQYAREAQQPIEADLERIRALGIEPITGNFCPRGRSPPPRLRPRSRDTPHPRLLYNKRHTPDTFSPRRNGQTVDIVWVIAIRPCSNGAPTTGLQLFNGDLTAVLTIVLFSLAGRKGDMTENAATSNALP